MNSSFQHKMQRTTVTLEFFTFEKSLYVIYNNKEMTILNFFKEPASLDIFKKIYRYLDANHHNELQTIHGKDWKEKLIKYIITHFPDKQNPLDVIIHSNDSITLNKER